MLMLPLPYPLTSIEATKRGIIFYAPFTPGYGARPLRLQGIDSNSAEAVDAVGSYINTDGDFRSAMNGVARIERKGILIEGARVNQLPAIQAFNSGSWIKSKCTVSADATIAPDGTLTADKIIPDTSGGNHDVYRSENFDGSSKYAWTCFAKADEMSIFTLFLPAQAFPSVPSGSFNLITGVATGGGGATAGMKALPNGWWFCWMQATSDIATTNIIRHRLSPAGGHDGVEGLFLWNTNLQVSNFITSSILVNDATRDPDDIQFDNTNEIHCRADRGSFACLVTPLFNASDHTAHAVIIDTRNGGDLNDGFVLYAEHTSNLYRWFVNSSNANIASMTSTSAAIKGTTQVLTVTWKLNEFLIYVNGILEGSILSGAAPTQLASSIRFGQSHSGTLPWFGNFAHPIISEDVWIPTEVRGLYDSMKNWV